MFLAPVEIHIQKQPQSPERMSNSSVTKKFPVKFWRLLHSCTGNALCWGVGGNSVRILKETFEKEYLLGNNKPFKTCSFSSFVRQLNLYGFRKVMRPVITNEYGQKLNTSLVEYKHPMFMKGHPELLLHINRKTTSQKRNRTKRNELSHGINKLKRKISEGSVKQSHEQREKALKIENHAVLDNITNKTNWTSRIDRVYIRGPFPQLVMGNTNSITETRKRSCAAGSPENDIKIKSTTSLAQADSTWTSKAKTHSKGKERSYKTDYCEADSTVGRFPGHTSTEASAKLEDEQDSTTRALVPGTLQTGSYTSQATTSTRLPGLGSQVVSGTLVPGSTHGQAILYMNQGPQLMFKMKSVNQTSRASQSVQSLKYSNGGRYKSECPLFSATCEDVASHPLLQPKNTYLHHTYTGTQGGPKSGQFPSQTLPDKQMKSSTALKTIPKNSHLASMSDQTALRQESDELTDLLSFKLSPSLQDIDAPTVSSDARGSHKAIPEMKISDLNLLNTLNMSYYRTPPGKLGMPQPRGEREPNVVKDTSRHTDAAHQSRMSGGRRTSMSTSTQTTEVDITSPQKASTTVNTDLPGGHEDHPHPRPQWEPLDERSGPKRELFKEHLGKRVITIPISGLPQNLFKLGMLGSGNSDADQAMVRLETSECGVVTGHLILPCK